MLTLFTFFSNRCKGYTTKQEWVGVIDTFCFFIQIEVLCLNDVTNQQDNPRNNVVFIIEILCLNDVMNQQDKPRNNVVFIYLCYSFVHPKMIYLI